MSLVGNKALFACAGFTIVLLVLLLSLSFSYLEYYEYGLSQRKTTGSVDTSKVYSGGRYFVGPDATFIKYRADAHQVNLEQLAVFSAGASESSIGTSFMLDIMFSYTLKEEEIGALHRESAKSYKSVIEARTKEAIKNEAVFVTFQEYFTERLAVEARLRNAVEKRWKQAPTLHCELDQFFLGRIAIPDEVARKQLETKIQFEKNDKEEFFQQARVERDMTDVEVNSILLERSKVLRIAEAEASLTRLKAQTESEKIVADARKDGASQLFNAANISVQEQKIALTYIQTIMERKDISLKVSYLDSDSVVKTKAA